MKKKKIKKVYDEHGNWINEKSRLISALKRTFRLHPLMKEVLTEAKIELDPLLKKDGTPSKRKNVRFKCNKCKKLFTYKNVQVDHKIPVVEIGKSYQDYSLDEIWERIRCKKNNLQVLCKPCHSIKSTAENQKRRELKKSKK